LITGYSVMLSIFVILLGCGCASTQRGLPLVASPGSVGDRGIAKEWNDRGIELASTGNPAEAEEMFRRALRANPAYAAAHNNLGIVLLGLGRFRESAIASATAARIEPRINLGRLYERVGWHSEAVAQYERALALQPDSESALGHLAHAFSTTGNTLEASDELLNRLAGCKNSEWKSWAVARLAAGSSGKEPEYAAEISAGVND